MQSPPPTSSTPTDDISSDILGGGTAEDYQKQRPSPHPHRPFYLHPAFMVVALVILILAALVGIRVIRRSRATQFQTTTVSRGNLTLSVSASGNVVAPEYDVSPTVQGTITTIDVTIGQRVTNGATLAALTYTDAHGMSQTETLTAPNAGTVVAINGIVNGSPTQVPFIVIDNLAAPYVLLNVNEADIASVTSNQTVTFTAPAYADLTAPFEGTIKTISAGGQNDNNVITYPVTITIETASLQGASLWPEMTINASIITAERENVLLIPDAAPSFAQSEADSNVVSGADVSAALRQAQSLLAQVKLSDRTAASDDLTASYVLTLRKNKLVVAPVVLGLSDGTNTEVLAGLADGVAVVTG